MKYFFKNFSSKIIVLVLAVMIIPPLLLYSYPQQDHEKIVEEVEINWWQVPVFAIDKDGKPVTDLKEEDIEIQLNGGKMPAFTLYKRAFTVTERKYETIEAPTAQQAPGLKKKVVFLLFDLALSGELSIDRSKNVAKKIISEAEEDTQFFILSIDTFGGLIYIGEGSGKNKDELAHMIKEKIKVKENNRIVSIAEILGDAWEMLKGAPESRRSKYEPEDIPLFVESVSKLYKRKSMGFFYAFETLYFLLNSIEDNKFIYFFTEGMSQSILTSNRSIAGNRGMYNFYIQRIGKYLERCGAVTFVINTMGVDQYYNSYLTKGQFRLANTNSFSSLSGEDSLHLLTQASGGTYMEGTNEQIVERLENMHNAYYEVSFPDPPQIKGMLRDVNIISKRKGVKIYSLKTLEKRKHYTRMNSIEKDMLALNLVTQPPNTMIKSKITAYNAQIEKTQKNKKRAAYTVTLPTSQSYRALDVYKLWLTLDTQGSAQVEKLEKESLKPQNNQLKIEFDLKAIADQKDQQAKEEEKQTQPREINTYFVLVNGDIDPARAYVHGIELYEEDPELVKLVKKKLAIQQKGSKTISTAEMNTILQGTADYCERLKQSAFHFYCQEKILETRIPLTDAENQSPTITEYQMQKGVVRAMDEIRNKAYTTIKGYLFGYRLIKQGDKIKENRDFIASRDEIPVNREQVLKTTAFFSEKAIFAPITMLDRTRQDMYDFQFVRYDQHNDRQAIVIEAIPKNTVENATIYGKIWIDPQDFSIMKIEADPRSMRSYKALEGIAKKLRTRLHLSLELEFDYLRNGIRFPTKVSMLEKYQGGRIISDHRGNKGWERTRAQFTYTDYQFFSVQTDVTVH